MRVFALILAACAIATLDWSGATHSKSVAATSAEERQPHISGQTMDEGSSVVLIRGPSSQGAAWDGEVSDLARNRRVILVQVIEPQFHQHAQRG